MSSHPTELFRAMQRARRAARRHAIAATRAGFQAHEQALTEILLTRTAPPLAVVPFTQRQEAATGADWLWWWRGTAGEWFGALVQAKRNKPRLGGPWYDFGYASSNGARQVESLLQSAAHLGVPAVYVLYNHPAVPDWSCLASPCCYVGRESWRTRLGVAVLPALLAGSLAGFEEVAPCFSRPLECLACRVPLRGHTSWLGPDIRDPQLQAFLQEEPPAGGARQVARMLLAQLQDLRAQQFGVATQDVVHRPSVSPDAVFKELPDDRGHFGEPYFEHVLRGLRSRAPWYIEELVQGGLVDGVAQELPDVAGVVIVDDVSEPE